LKVVRNCDGEWWWKRGCCDDFDGGKRLLIDDFDGGKSG
jgi:hypothetical protein